MDVNFVTTNKNFLFKILFLKKNDVKRKTAGDQSSSSFY